MRAVDHFSPPSRAAVAASAPSPSTASGAPSFATTSSPPASASVAPVRVFGSYRAAPMIRGRVGFDAVLLGDGTVLAIGDDKDCYPGGALEGSERAESYDPATDTWTEEDSLNKPRKLPATVVLPDGSAMVIGGVNSDDEAFSSTKVFSPATRSWSDGPLLGVARATPIAAILVDERVLVVDWQTLAVADDERDLRPAIRAMVGRSLAAPRDRRRHHDRHPTPPRLLRGCPARSRRGPCIGSQSSGRRRHPQPAHLRPNVRRVGRRRATRRGERDDLRRAGRGWGDLARWLGAGSIGPTTRSGRP